MGEVRTESEPRKQGRREWLGQRRIGLHQGVAAFADEVLVHPSGPEVVDARGVTEVRMTDDAGLLERPERPIDR